MLSRVFCPNTIEEVGHCKEPISEATLKKGDAFQSTQKCILGWDIDSLAHTISLPLHHVQWLNEIIIHFLNHLHISCTR